MRASREALIVTIILLQAPPTVGWALAPSLKVVSLEVTQSIQDTDNSVLLVTGRPTAIRTRVDVSGVAASKVLEITTSRLTATRMGGGSLGPITNPQNKSAFLAFLKSGQTYDRAKENHTLNFQIDDLPVGKWKFEVEVGVKVQGEQDPLSGTVGTGTRPLDCVKIRPVHFCLVPLKYKAADGTMQPAPAKAKLKKAEEFLRACFPLPTSADIDWKPPELMPDEIKVHCTVGVLDAYSPSEDQPNDVDQWLERLSSMKEATAQGVNPKPDVYYFGWVENDGEDPRISDGNCNGVLGWSSCAVGFGTAREKIAGKVLAHEFGHMLGLDHCGDYADLAPCPVNKEVGWDFSREPGSRTRAGCHSVMICGDEHHQAPITSENVWITPKDYAECLKALREESSQPSPSDCAKQPDPNHPTSRTLLVQGGLSEDGSRLVWLKPQFPFPWYVGARISARRGPYEVKAVATDGTEFTQSFDPKFRVEYVKFDKGAGQPRYGYFCVVVPILDNKEIQQVTIRRNNTDLEPTIEKRTDRPVIEEPSLAQDAILDKEIVMSWIGKAKDQGIRLRYHVLYSPDGGQQFEAVGVNLRNSKVVFDPSRLTPSKEGKGLVRIFVSDGLNTVPFEIKGLTVRKPQ